VTPASQTRSWTILVHERHPDPRCESPVTMLHLPTLVYGALGVPAVVASRTAAEDLRWAVIGLYSSSDDEPATCMFRPARLDDLAISGCVAIESDGSRRAFPEIGPLTAMMAWPLCFRLATPRESELWIWSREGRARSIRGASGGEPVMVTADDLAEMAFWKVRSIIDYPHALMSADEAAVPGDRRQSTRG
jgi:hypothetical protein